jgi:hypothetical protein
MAMTMDMAGELKNVFLRDLRHKGGCCCFERAVYVYVWSFGHYTTPNHQNGRLHAGLISLLEKASGRMVKVDTGPWCFGSYCCFVSFILAVRYNESKDGDGDVCLRHSIIIINIRSLVLSSSCFLFLEQSPLGRELDHYSSAPGACESNDPNPKASDDSRWTGVAFKGHLHHSPGGLRPQFTSLYRAPFVPSAS